MLRTVLVPGNIAAVGMLIRMLSGGRAEIDCGGTLITGKLIDG